MAQTSPPIGPPALGNTQQKLGVCGPLVDQLIRCPRFGFSYKVPFGWVDRTSDMQAESGPNSGDAQGDTQTNMPDQPSSEDSQTLLAVFERPPGATGDAINSAVVITAEPLANYHGVKAAADYFGAIKELAEQRGFKATSAYEFPVGAKRLVRGDFNKERGKLIMYQTSLVMMANSYFVSFTFIGGSEDDIEALIENLNFVSHTRPSTTAHH